MSITITLKNINQYRVREFPTISRLKWEILDTPDNRILHRFPNLKALDCSSTLLSSLEGITGCHQITELCIDNNQLKTLKGIENFPNLEILDCNMNSITSLDGLEHTPRMGELMCSANRITSLAGLEQYTLLKKLDCSSNRIKSLTGLRCCLLLEKLVCNINSITVFDGLDDLSQLRHLDCSHNQITSLEGLVNCPSLRELLCNYNRLASLAGIEACTQLSRLSCTDNRITDLRPLVYLRHLMRLHYHGNPIDIQTIQTQRMLEQMQRQPSYVSASIYNNRQNVHDIHIQKTVCDSVRNLLCDAKPNLHLDCLITNSGLPERAVRLLLEYCRGNAIHSVYLLTYRELLMYVWARIEKSDHRCELLKILAEQVLDSKGMCFTGRFNRLVSVLVGFYPDIVIEISDSSRIGAIILAVKERLESYHPTAHREIAHRELLGAGYTEVEIEPWLKAIDEA